MANSKDNAVDKTLKVSDPAENEKEPGSSSDCSKKEEKSTGAETLQKPNQEKDAVASQSSPQIANVKPVAAKAIKSSNHIDEAMKGL